MLSLRNSKLQSLTCLPVYPPVAGRQDSKQIQIL